MTPDDLRKYCPELNALHEHIPVDSFDLTNKQNPVNVRNEQQKVRNIVTVLQGLATGPPPSSQNLNSELMKYLKHFDRLENHNGIFHRNIYDHTGRKVIRQYVVPQHMRKEIV